MKEFQYFQIKSDIHEDYLLLTSTEDAYYLYEEMYAEISQNKGEKFSIILDLILRNGFAFNRFILLEFSGENVLSKIINPREVPEDIKFNTKKYLCENRDLLHNSALSNSAINFITTINS